MKKLLPLFLAALVGLASCTKTGTDSTPAPTPSRADLLTASPWQWTAHREVVTPTSGGAAVVTTSIVPPGTLKVIYNTDGTIFISYPSRQGSPTSGGQYTVLDSTIRSNLSYGGIIRELTANRLVLVNNWQTQHTDTFTH